MVFPFQLFEKLDLVYSVLSFHLKDLNWWNRCLVIDANMIPGGGILYLLVEIRKKKHNFSSFKSQFFEQNVLITCLKWFCCIQVSQQAVTLWIVKRRIPQNFWIKKKDFHQCSRKNNKKHILWLILISAYQCLGFVIV